jgi:hypothetical protein
MLQELQAYGAIIVTARDVVSVVSLQRRCSSRCCNSWQHCSAAMVGVAANFFVFFYSTASRVFNHLLLCLYAREREKKMKKKKRERALKLAPRYITPHLVSFFLAPPILALLVGRGVIAQAPSSNRNIISNNISIKKKFKNSKPKEICHF